MKCDLIGLFANVDECCLILVLSILACLFVCFLFVCFVCFGCFFRINQLASSLSCQAWPGEIGGGACQRVSAPPGRK